MVGGSLPTSSRHTILSSDEEDEADTDDDGNKDDDSNKDDTKIEEIEKPGEDDKAELST